MNNEIYKKIGKILKIIQIVFCLILLRTWHLGVIQKEERLQNAIKPQRRVIVQKANRGVICDRNDVALAVNKIKYNATIYYSHIRDLPYIKYEKNFLGKKTKRYVRKEYIKKLSDLLAPHLALDTKRIEDMIYAKASILPHIPYVIKENISEDTYYKLKMLQRDWPGLYLEISQERFYPFSKVASDLIGYMGQISQDEYFQIIDEIEYLQNILKKYEDEMFVSLGEYKNIDEVKKRLSNIQKLAYSSHDLVGKAAMEKLFEESLKGFHEKKTLAVDVKGNILKQLDGFEKPENGSKVRLAICKELQELAENLLMEDEKIRDEQNISSKTKHPLKQPLEKGGAIIAMDPNSGEILACASYPRFDPNDFIPSSNPIIRQKKQKNINQWLETTHHIADMFDGEKKLTKESYSEEKDLDFEAFQNIILSRDSSIKKALEKIKNIKNAIFLQEGVESLLYFSQAKDVKTLLDAIFFKKSDLQHIDILNNLKEHSSYIDPLRKRVESFLFEILDNRDKIFTVDICRMLVYSNLFSDELIAQTGFLSLSEYWSLTKSIIRTKNFLKKELKPIFQKVFFEKWREENEKTFLKAKRMEEKEKKTYARPYLDYLDRLENELFDKFWQDNFAIFLTHILRDNVYNTNLSDYFHFIKSLNKETIQDDLLFIRHKLTKLDSASLFDFVKTIRSFDELQRPLLYNYPRMRSIDTKKTEKHLAACFYPASGFAYSRSYAISNSISPGSIFKLVIAYTALKEKYKNLLDDKKSLNYLNPLTLIDDLFWDSNIKKGGGVVVSKTLDGKSYPRFYKKGRLPRSARSGIGKIDLVKALEVSSNPYFSILATDHINSPYDLIKSAKDFNIGSKTNIDLLGEIKGNLPEDIIFNKTSLYSFAIGQHSLIVTPVQTAVMLSAIANKGKILKPQLIRSDKPEIKQTIEMPDEIRYMLLDGLDRVISSKSGGARPNIIKYLRKDQKLLKEYKNAYHQFVGKTSTAEFMYNPNMNPSSKAQKYKNIWFGAIAFEPPKKGMSKKQIWEKPELVIVVELNFGFSGKEAAPLAFQIMQKYRELKKISKD